MYLHVYVETHTQPKQRERESKQGPGCRVEAPCLLIVSSVVTSVGFLVLIFLQVCVSELS